ncbi:hypothetical protein SteCoe_18241 [Stentor coeruleus]|uniref:RanBP2-type domain-containing protein n=1 Tax=Stentor coeruleus TaxID=5963 RepID=A0A1R2BWZ8_9CILI|nr:hypothetical protein SteCoe_18241 [Stentor coeruleus]
MLPSRLGLSDLTFDPIREPNDSFLITALKVFFSNNKFINSIQKDLNKCRHSQNPPCIISSLYTIIDQYKSGLIINTLPLRQSLANLYENENKFTLDSSDWDIIETMSIILNAIHAKAIDLPCNIQNKDALVISCNNTCPFHSIFYLGVDENHICECGNESSNPWDYTNMCQYFNINEIFEEYNQDASKEMSKLPNFIIKEKNVQGNSQVFIGKIISKLQDRLRDAKCENCFLDECEIRRSKISFSLTKCPEVYLINLIWENNNPFYLEVMLATASASSTLMIDEIYGIGPKTRYNLKGIIFQRYNSYDYAYRNGNIWKFTGLHENSGWYELLQEVTVLKYLPICLVYEKTPLNQPYNFDIKIHKLMFVEKFASECEEYELMYRNQVIPPEKKISGLFLKEKKKIKGKKDDYNFDNLMKDNRIDQRSLPVSKKIENTTDNLKFIRKTELPKFDEEEKVLIEHQNPTFIEKNPPSLTRKIWKCKCGSENSDIWEVCCKCYELKPGIEGWVCEYCKAKNDIETLYICSTCREINNRPHYSNKKDDDIKSFNIYNNPKEPKSISNNPDTYFLDEEWGEKNQNLANQSKKSSGLYSHDNIWDCECGSSNIEEWEICQKCDKIKPGLGGWVCKFCKARNPPENIYRCSQCDTSKNETSAKEQEYWSCKTCKTANRSYAYICEECGESKDQLYDYMSKKDNLHNSSERLKAQKWKCIDCKFENSIDKEKCIYCQLQNPYIPIKNLLDTEEKVEVLKWKCKCGKINEESSKLCNGCYTIKKEYENKSAVSKTDIKNMAYNNYYDEKNQEQVWKCIKCNQINDDWKSKCKTCGFSKYENKITENITIEYWKCPRCLYNQNQNDQNICYKCKTAKEIRSVEALPSRCKECFKDINIVMCPNCKEGVRIKEKCIKCSGSLNGIIKCYSCDENNQKNIKKGFDFGGLGGNFRRNKYGY